MEEEEYFAPEPELEEDTNPIFSGATLIQQGVICLLIILGIMATRQIPWIGPKIQSNFRWALSADADRTFGKIARLPLVRDLVGWAKDGWQSMSVQTPSVSTMAIHLIPPVPGVIKVGFGWQPAKIGQKQEFHAGIDIVSPSGRPVRASCDGMIQDVRQDSDGLWQVSILHKGGWRTVYGNCGTITVKPGQSVQTGQELGTTMKSPTEGEVVHWEIWQGVQPYDPRSFMGT